MKINDNTKEYLFWISEKYFPCFLGGVAFISVIIVTLKINISISSFEKILDTTITLSSIIVGFVGVLLGLLFSIRNTEIVDLLFKRKSKYVLKSYFRNNILSGILLVLVSLALYFNEFIGRINIVVKYIVYGVWGFLLVYTIASAYRITDIIMFILFCDEENENSEPEPVIMDEERKRELKNRYSR